MQTSQVFKSSLHCKPSPDGRYVATVGTSTATIRSTETLQSVNVIDLPPEIAGPITALHWSPTSSRILIATADHIEVFSAYDSSFHASIRNPLAGGGKPPAIRFGAYDTEVVVFSSFGLKVVIFDLSSSKALEINNPKFYLPATLTRGFSLRPETSHLALLTRTGGKDIISIHHPVTRQVQRSWSPDVLDAHGLTWTPDGQWLVIWESPAYGHRLFLYTADGQYFRTISSSSLSQQQGTDLEAGIKHCELSPNSELCAIGDHSRGIVILRTDTWRDTMRLLHPTTIMPRDTLQVWQEQLGVVDSEGRSTHTAFVRAANAVSPPASNSNSLTPGCSLAAFDAASSLLATRLDDSPCTLWIWDVVAVELRAVLIFHSTVTFRWHPFSRELLLVNCQDETRQGVSFVWDPLSEGPILAATEEHLPKAAKTAGKKQVVWIGRGSEYPELLLSDAQHYALISLSDADQHPNPWKPADDYESTSLSLNQPELTNELNLDIDDTSVLDDTFSFRNP